MIQLRIAFFYYKKSIFGFAGVKHNVGLYEGR